MNFFDFELSRNATATPPQSSGQEGTSGASEPSLNEEVSQVVGQLGKLWGGFRKQVCFFVVRTLRNVVIFRSLTNKLFLLRVKLH